MQNRVFVLDHKGQALMPCTPRKARILMEHGLAKPVKKTPFTIQLQQSTHSYKQHLEVGIDSGQRCVGIAVIHNDEVWFKAEVQLRTDVKKRIDTRRSYRVGRRHRKTRYRKPRFNNRIAKFNKLKKRGLKWFAPSVAAKINHNINWIRRILDVLPADTHATIELGKFDPHKLKNPNVTGSDYQKGDLYGYENRRMYILSRDDYRCQICKRTHYGETRQPLRLHVHHIIYRSNGGSDRVENLLTVCTDCHTHRNHQPGGELYRLQEEHFQKRRFDLSAATQMNAIKSNIVREFENNPNVDFTYGYVTNIHRKRLGLPKSHADDAIAITGVPTIGGQPESTILFRQRRKKKRSLHDANARRGRKEPNRTQRRSAKNTPSVYVRKTGTTFYLGDHITVGNHKGYISGFSKSMCYVKDCFDRYIRIRNSNDVIRRTINLSACKRINHSSSWSSYTVEDELLHPTT